MDKNTITGLVLIGAILLGFQWWSTPSKEELAEIERQDSIAQVEQVKAEERAQQQAQKEQERRIQALTDSTSIFFAHKSGEAKDIVLQNEKVSVTINTHGGTVEKAVIKGYNDQAGDEVRLLTPGENHMALALATKTENIDSRDLYFEAVDQSETSVTMRLVASNGGTLDICYTLHPESYMLDMVVTSDGIGNYFAPSMRTMDIEWQSTARQQEKGYTFENRYSMLTYKEKDDDTEKLNDTGNDEETPEKAVDWIAFKNQFFSAILIAHNDFTGVNLKQVQMDKGTGYLKDYKAQMQTAFDPTGKEATKMQMYLGPVNFHLLKDANELSMSDKKLDLDELVYFGWPIVRWINRWFILYLFDWLTALGLPMGIVLLLLTLIVKVLVYPATRKSYLSSARMRVLKPEVDKLNAKYPKQEDALKKQQEMMQLYSQYGVSPMGGCLPMLIQMPIWVALFNFVPNAIELRGESFLWAKDLSAYDDLIHWSHNIWLIGDHISIFCLLFTLTNVVNTIISMRQQKNAMMSPEQEQQMKMMQYMMFGMPVMFFFMFNDYSSGLCYYYFLSGLTSILMMWGLRKFTDDNKLLEELKAYKARHASDPKKSMGGLAARLEAMQKMAEEQQRQRSQK